MRKMYLVFLMLCSTVASAAESWYVGMDLMYGRSSYSVSNCNGDCAYLPTNPGSDWHLGLGTTIQNNSDGARIGATLRVYDSSNTDAFSRFLDGFVRLSLPIGSWNPYVGAGISYQDYDARLANARGGTLRNKQSAPLYVLGVEKRGEWGFWFLEIARTDDHLTANSYRETGATTAPVAVDFDIERTTVMFGASVNLARP